MAALREILIAFGMTVDASPIDKAEDKVSGFLDKIKEAGAALASAFAVKKLWDFEQGMVSLGDQLGDSAARLGISTEALESWQYAAQFAEISGEELQGMFEKVSRAAFGAADAGSEAGKAIKKLGVHVKDTSGNFKTGDVLFEDIGLALSKMKDGVDRTSLAIQFFGRGAGPKIIQLFKDGKPGLESYRQEFEALGGGMGDFAAEAGEVDDQQKRLNFSFGMLKVKIAGVLLPAFSWIVSKGIEVAAAFNQVAEETHVIQTAFIVMGAIASAKAVQILIAYAPVIGTFLLWAASLAFVALALEDIYGFFTGKNSLIGKAIDKLFGKGASEKVREWASSVWGLVKEVGDKFVEIFGNSKTTIFEKFQELVAYFEGAFADKAREIFGDIGGDVIAQMASAVSEVIGIFAGAADQVRKIFGGVFEYIADGIFKAQNGAANEQAKLDRGAADGKAPASVDSVKDHLKQAPWYMRALASATGFDPEKAVPVRVPASTTNTTHNTSAPVVNQNISVAPGTPQAQQRALAAAAAKGTTGALQAPNRAAATSLERRGT